MRRAALVLIALGVVLAAAVMPVRAEGLLPLSPESWAGGNGWCEGGICFRAWSLPQGVEVRWLVDLEVAPTLTVLRRQLAPATEAAAVTVAGSSTTGEFIYQDSAVSRGALYQYQLVRDDGAVVLGEALEAGLVAAAVEPGGSGPHLPHLVYLPALSRH